MLQVVGGFVSLAGVAFAMAATRRAPDKDWMPTRAEQESIAAPLTSIALRHAPEGELEDAGDLVDGIGVAVATGAYAMRASTGQPGGAVEAGATMQPPPPPPAPEPPTPTPPGWGG